MKKTLPIIVLETLEKYVDKKGEEFEVIEPERFLLKVVDKDPSSGFYYNIEQYKVDGSNLKLLIDAKPFSKITTENNRNWIQATDLDSSFANWVGLLKKYNSVKSFYDDPIIEKFKEEYFEYFEIIDEDAEREPYNPEHILLINDHLTSLIIALEVNQTEDNRERIEDIKEEILVIQSSLTKKPKKWIVNKMALVYAKISKEGTEFIITLYDEIKKLGTKEAAKGIFNLAKKAFTFLIDLS